MDSSFEEFIASARGTVTTRSHPIAARIRTRVEELLYRILGTEATQSDLLALRSHARTHNAIISGSTVLEVLMDSFEAWDVTWFVPARKSEGFIRFFVDLGYNSTNAVDTGRTRAVFTHWAHDKPAYNLFELERKSSRRIIVVESTTNSPLHPFAYAHSTAAMSFLSMDALYVAHPEHLRRNWNVINLNCALPSINTLLQTGDEKPCYKATYPCVSFPTLGVFTLRDEEDMGKYLDRGFDWVPRVTLDHICREGELCPHTVRSVVDRFGLLIIFDENASDAIGNGDKNLEFSTRTMGGDLLTWRLGGPACSDTERPTSGFVNFSYVSKEYLPLDTFCSVCNKYCRKHIY